MEVETLDVLYILGTGSKWLNNEIRYSLRSIEMFLPHARVFIVGHLPQFIRKESVTHIPCNDPTKSKLVNSIYKLKRACHNKQLGSRFVLMNDDFFFLKPVPRIRLFRNGSLAKTIEKHPTKNGYYYEAMLRTQQLIEGAGIHVPQNYALHYPFVVEKKKALELMERFPWQKDGYQFRNLYANIYLKGGFTRNDVKMRKSKDLDTRQFKGIDLFSTDDAVVSDARFQRFMRRHYPKASQYERENVQDLSPGLERPSKFHAHRKFTYGDRTYMPGDIIDKPIPASLAKKNGLVPIAVQYKLTEEERGEM